MAAAAGVQTGVAAGEAVSAAHAAAAPASFPARSWWRALKRAAVGVSASSFGIVAGGCAFYALLALFPALSALVSVYGLAADPATIESQLASLRSILPPDVTQLIGDRLHELVAAGSATLGWSLGLSVLLAVYGASAGVKALLTALDLAYLEDEKRSFLRFNMVALIFTGGAIIGVILALVVVLAVPAVLAVVPLGPFAEAAARLASWLIFAGLLLFALAMVYRYGPSRANAKWTWVTPGSVVAAILLLIGSVGFSIYAQNFGDYNVTYGSLGAVVVLLFWFYISAYVVLFGGRLNAELEHETAVDTTTGPQQPLGERGAFVADHVAA